ncbi:hypothetical protein DFH06DRAFT_1483657 [Mycena polygramma]|nr:hypothetical protein DFH06DRAFT_1483657 [Mycena polygramma]
MSFEDAQILTVVARQHITSQPNRPYAQEVRIIVGGQASAEDVQKLEKLRRHGQNVLKAHLDEVLDRMLFSRGLATPVLLDALEEELINMLEVGNPSANSELRPPKKFLHCCWTLKGVMEAIKTAAEGIPARRLKAGSLISSENLYEILFSEWTCSAVLRKLFRHGNTLNPFSTIPDLSTDLDALVVYLGAVLASSEHGQIRTYTWVNAVFGPLASEAIGFLTPVIITVPTKRDAENPPTESTSKNTKRQRRPLSTTGHPRVRTRRVPTKRIAQPP